MSATGGFGKGSSGGTEASKKRGPSRPPGSRNKKTLAALGAGAGPPALPRRPLLQQARRDSVRLSRHRASHQRTSPSTGMPPLSLRYWSGAATTFACPPSSWRGWKAGRLRVPSYRSAAPASCRTTSRSITTARGSATSATGGQSSSRTIACRRAGSFCSPVVRGRRSSSSVPSMAPSAPAPLSPSREGECLHRLLVDADLVGLKRGPLQDEVHAALVPCRGRRASPR
jgi:hypothetical protein